MNKLLSDEFLARYGDFPGHMTALGKLIYYRTYSRWLPNEKRRETFKETCTRAVSYNAGLCVGDASEAELLFDSMFNLRSFLSGRTLWVGGTDIASDYPMSNFNCAFTTVTSWNDVADIFYLLMIGSGVGFRILQRDVAQLPRISNSRITLINEEYTPLPLNQPRNEDTITEIEEGCPVAYIVIGDSKEGWVNSIKSYFDIMTNPKYSYIEELHVIYDYIRPKGTRLKRFGGTASGGESMVVMFQKIHEVLTTDRFAPKPVNGVVRPIHVLDICNIIGKLVVSGGVRRTAEIALLDPEDTEALEARANIGPDNDHRYVSNNSVYYEAKPSRAELHAHFMAGTRTGGDLGFINAEAAKKRKPSFEGVNPCGEILLKSKQLCNLVTTNCAAFVYEGTLDMQGLTDTIKLMTRAALRMTTLKFELPNWEAVRLTDSIVGVSLMGWYDMLDAIGVAAGSDDEIRIQRALRSCVKEEARSYAKVLGINEPQLATTMKPEGTLSKVAGSVSAGCHRNRARHYIRRVRISATDPMLKALEAQGLKTLNEAGEGVYNSKGEYVPINTKVLEFGVGTTAKTTAASVTLEEQFRTYFNFQKHYTDHNTSITIELNNYEWDEAEETVWENWDELIGVTFLARDNSYFPLLPEEPCTARKYNELAVSMVPISETMLNKYELELDNVGVDFELTESGCTSGACPVR